MAIDGHMLLQWTVLAAGLTVAPGPDTLLTASQAARSGLRAGLMTMAGIVSGGAVYALLCGLGFLSLLTLSAPLYWTVRIAGAAYLAFIGLAMIRSALRRAESTASIPRSLSGGPFRQGFLTNALNPKVALFYLAVLPQFSGKGSDAPLVGVFLIAIHYGLAAIWLSGAAWISARAGRRIGRSRLTRGLEGLVGLLLCGVAGRLAFERT